MKVMHMSYKTKKKLSTKKYCDHNLKKINLKILPKVYCLRIHKKIN